MIFFPETFKDAMGWRRAWQRESDAVVAALRLEVEGGGGAIGKTEVRGRQLWVIVEPSVAPTHVPTDEGSSGERFVI